MGKDEQKTVLLVTSFYLLSCSLEGHSESTDEGSNSSCVREKWVYVPSSHPLSYLIIQGVCLFLALLVEGLWRIARTLSVFWPVNTFDLSRQFIIIHVHADVIKKRHCMRLDDEMRLGHFSLCIYGQFYFQPYSEWKIILLEWSNCQ